MLVPADLIEKYIPQRAPVVMVGDLLEADDTHAVTRTIIREENIFVNDGLFSESGLVENIAQTAATQVGYQYALRKIPVPIGYIAAVKDLAIIDLPKVGDSITTTLQIKNKVMDVILAEGKVERDRELIASCEIRIFVKE